jgi:tRNA threonylcarbamoyladenosine biosynthesis protein TsaE
MAKEWIFELENIDRVSQELLENIPSDSKVFLSGEMGSGKTTLCKSIIKNMGFKQEVSSPTHSIINDYFNSVTGQKVHHMDLYRLKHIEEALDIGIEDFMFDESLCLIEWPEIIDSLANEKTLRLNVISVSDNQRKLIFL